MSSRPSIFISYAREDLPVAHRLFLLFKRLSFVPWMDKPPHPYTTDGLLGGESWKDAISRKINESDYFLLLLTQVSVSKRGFVQKEFRYALDKMNEVPAGEIYVIPALIDDCQPPNLTVGTISLSDLNWVALQLKGSGVIKGAEVIIATIKRSFRLKRISQHSPSTQHSSAPNQDRFRRMLHQPHLRLHDGHRQLSELKDSDFADSLIVRWKSEVGKQNWTNRPCIHENVLIFGSSGYGSSNNVHAGVYALNASTGEKVWFSPTNAKVNEVLHSEKSVFAGTDTGVLHCIDSFSGKSRWQLVFDAPIFSRPIAFKYKAQSVVVACSYDGTIRVVQEESASIISEINIEDTIRANSSIVYQEDDGLALYIVGERGKLYKVEFSMGALRCTLICEINYPDIYSSVGKSNAEVYAAPVVHGRTIYIGYCRQTSYNYPPVVAIDEPKGEVLWHSTDPLDHK